MSPPLRLSRASDAPRHAAPRVALPGAPAVDPAPLLGTWVSFDTATGGIVRVVVDRRGGRLAVRAFGAASPAPRDWGEVAGDAFAGAVASAASAVDGEDSAIQENPETPEDIAHAPAAAVGFTARYGFGFLDTLLAAYLNRRLLVVDSYNVFRDGSGRASYFSRDHFYQPAASASRA